MSVANTVEHTQRGPSGYSRWSVCTASPAAIESVKKKGLVPSDNSSPDSILGTVAHCLLAVCLELMISPRDFIGQDLFVPELNESFPVTPEIGEETDKGYEYICTFIGKGATVWVETKLSLQKVLPGEKGTADVVILVTENGVLTLHVFDFKFGIGVPVSVEKNGQMMLYTIGAFDELLTYEQRLDVRKIYIHVVQPRINNIAAWEVTKKYLESFRVEANHRFKITFDPSKREFVPGSQCRFCDLKTRCRTLKESIYKWTLESCDATGFDAFRSPDTMSDDQLAQLWPMLDFLGAWVTNMKKYMDNEAAKGRKFGDLKLIVGRHGNREWKNLSEAEFYLTFDQGLSADQIYNQQLISPSQAEKLIGRKLINKDEFGKLVNRTEAKPTLASASDPRQTYQQTLADEFDD